MTDGLIQDGGFSLLLTAMFAFFWVHPWRRQRVLTQSRARPGPNSLDVRRKAD
jgi:hypothetical protein